MTPFRQLFIKSNTNQKVRDIYIFIYTFSFINYMIRLEIGFEIRHRGAMSLWAIEDKTAVVVVASYRSVSRNPVHFKALVITTVCVKIDNCFCNT